MARKRKKRKQTLESVPPEPSPTHTEWLWIAAAFLSLGSVMLFAQRGTVTPVPEGTRGAAQGAVLVRASDMRMYGWFNLILGLIAVGAFVWLRRRTAAKAAAAGGAKPLPSSQTTERPKL